MSIGFMSHVGFKKCIWPCHPVEFKGQGPHLCVVIVMGLKVGVDMHMRESGFLSGCVGHNDMARHSLLSHDE